MLLVAFMVVGVMLLIFGLVVFFVDPVHVPDKLLEVLDRRASVVSMFVGMMSLLVAGAAL
ncbi:hypothetical protein SAMN05216276_10652 [Streptosporangium subroseum]|uniref:Uncharacterized protein n=1 Tax=Streptosporangium subroseum TaxID=106412 RepID=A0A239NPF8_9ACTN|nr:hypothetical protein [Streptosporangium subroseum]SNT56725.1 hypothetical protein SAMN05216276_10652 [Streptosporangium subroseum]